MALLRPPLELQRRKQRATKMMRGQTYNTPQRLKESFLLFGDSKEKAPIAVFNYLMGGCREDGARLTLEAHSKRMMGSRCRLQNGKSWLGTWVTHNGIPNMKTSPGDTVGSLSLRKFSIWPDSVPSNMSFEGSPALSRGLDFRLSHQSKLFYHSVTLLLYSWELFCIEFIKNKERNRVLQKTCWS